MQDAPTFTSAAEQAAALRRREVLPKQQHRQVSRLPRQHDCVDSTGLVLDNAVHRVVHVVLCQLRSTFT